MSSAGSDIGEIEERRDSAHSLKIEPPTSMGTRILQLLIIALFFAGMIGAFCYAILDRESGTGSSDGNEIEPNRNASLNWTVLWTEYSDSGYCVFVKFPNEEKSEDSGEEDEPGEKIESYWYQDNDLQRLFTRIDEKYAAYVFPTYTWWAVIDPISEETKVSFLMNKRNLKIVLMVMIIILISKNI